MIKRGNTQIINFRRHQVDNARRAAEWMVGTKDQVAEGWVSCYCQGEDFGEEMFNLGLPT